MESLRRSLIMIIALSTSLSVSVAHPGHDGRNHKHKHARHQGAFAGIQIVSSPGGPYPTDLLLSDALVPVSVVTTVPRPVPLTQPLSKTTDTLMANVTSKSFSTTVTQIAVATICLGNISLHLPVPYTVSVKNNISPLHNTGSARHLLLNTTSVIHNLTENLPISSSTSVAVPTASLADPNARIILGDNDCQTIFTPVTTAICSTVLPIAGQLPISVTDCEQWVTFSSSPVCDGAGTAGAGEATAYFLAPWYEIASGGVPAEVQVQTCSSASGLSNCVTGRESWTVRTATVQSTVMRTAHFHGGAIGPLNITLLPNLLTVSIPSTSTTLSIDTTITHLAPHVVPTIVRPRLDPTTTSTNTVETTITTTIKVPVTKTYRLEAITHHATVTVTVQETVTSLVVVERGSVTPDPSSTFEAIQTQTGL